MILLTWDGPFDPVRIIKTFTTLDVTDAKITWRSEDTTAVTVHLPRADAEVLVGMRNGGHIELAIKPAYGIQPKDLGDEIQLSKPRAKWGEK